MTIRNFPLNQVLTYNQVIAVADFIDCPPNTDRYEAAVKSAQEHVNQLASQAEEMVAAWNKTNAYAIKLKVQRNSELGYRIVGHWRYGLEVYEYNQELNTHEVARKLSKEAYQVVTDVIRQLKINYCIPDNYMHAITNGIREELFNSNSFRELRNTSFFKHFTKAFDPNLLKANYHENDDQFVSFYSNDKEQQAGFKKMLTRTFKDFLESGSNHIVDSVISFELEQIALASAQACLITQVCSFDNKKTY